MDVRPNTVSNAMTRFEQRPPKSLLPRADRRNAARHVRSKLPRARIVPVPFTPPRTELVRGKLVTPRTARRGSRLTPEHQHQMDEALKRLVAMKTARGA